MRIEAEKSDVQRARCLVLKEIWAIITANFGQMGSNAFKIGDKVRFLNDVGEGRVTGMQNEGQVLLKTTTGLNTLTPPVI